LDRAPLAGSRGVGGIANYRYTRDARRYLFKKLQPFRAYGVLEHEETGGVAARAGEVLDETGADWTSLSPQFTLSPQVPLCLHYSVASMGNISNPATWNKVGWPSEYAGLTVAQGTSWNAKSARLKVIKMPLYIPWQGCALMVS
jgi:hypothetical protein